METMERLLESDLDGTGMLTGLLPHLSCLNGTIRMVLRLMLRDGLNPRSGRLTRALDELFTSRYLGLDGEPVIVYIRARVPERYHSLLSRYKDPDYLEIRKKVLESRRAVKISCCSSGCDLGELVRGSGKHSKPKRFCPKCGRVYATTGERDEEGRLKYKFLGRQVALSSIERETFVLSASIYN